MTKERLEELKKLCEDASSGPDADTLYNAIEKLYEVSITAIPELITAYEKAVGMLRKLEWSSHMHTYIDGFDEIMSCCPVCGCIQSGHSPDCELKKILEVL